MALTEPRMLLELPGALPLSCPEQPEPSCHCTEGQPTTPAKPLRWSGHHLIISSIRHFRGLFLVYVIIILTNSILKLTQNSETP